MLQGVQSYANHCILAASLCTIEEKLMQLISVGGLQQELLHIYCQVILSWCSLSAVYSPSRHRSTGYKLREERVGKNLYKSI